MTGPVRAARLTAALWECDRHRTVLVEALDEWQHAPALHIEALEHDSALRRLTDQIIYRFTKMQDAMGERLVPVTLGWLREPHEDWSMRDRLDRLERLGFLDVDAWLQWRDVRNRLAHEYPDQADLRFAALLAAMDAARGMVQVYDRWKPKLPS
ncbi:MAG: hypothetical protein Q8L49_05755 [Burkholderiaceae bacterium]|nr:hypothetical protein [Burkholderiaceae bacterium]